MYSNIRKYNDVHSVKTKGSSISNIRLDTKMDKIFELHSVQVVIDLELHQRQQLQLKGKECVWKNSEVLSTKTQTPYHDCPVFGMCASHLTKWFKKVFNETPVLIKPIFDKFKVFFDWTNNLRESKSLNILLKFDTLSPKARMIFMGPQDKAFRTIHVNAYFGKVCYFDDFVYDPETKDYTNLTFYEQALFLSKMKDKKAALHKQLTRDIDEALKKSHGSSQSRKKALDDEILLLRTQRAELEQEKKLRVVEVLKEYAKTRNCNSRYFLCQRPEDCPEHAARFAKGRHVRDPVRTNKTRISGQVSSAPAWTNKSAPLNFNNSVNVNAPKSQSRPPKLPLKIQLQAQSMSSNNSSSASPTLFENRQPVRSRRVVDRVVGRCSPHVSPSPSYQSMEGEEATGRHSPGISRFFEQTNIRARRRQPPIGPPRINPEPGDIVQTKYYSTDSLFQARILEVTSDDYLLVKFAHNDSNDYIPRNFIVKILESHRSPRHGVRPPPHRGYSLESQRSVGDNGETTMSESMLGDHSSISSDLDLVLQLQDRDRQINDMKSNFKLIISALETKTEELRKLEERYRELECLLQEKKSAIAHLQSANRAPPPIQPGAARAMNRVQSGEEELRSFCSGYALEIFLEPLKEEGFECLADLVEFHNDPEWKWDDFFQEHGITQLVKRRKFKRKVETLDLQMYEGSHMQMEGSRI